MAIEQKLKITRDQFAEFIKDHKVIRQFERLFEYVNTFVFPEPPVNTSNCFIEKYDTGWIPNSTWTGVQLLAEHNLNANLTDLFVNFYISTDGTEDNAEEIKDTNRYDVSTTPRDNDTGIGVFQNSLNEVGIITGAEGVSKLDKSNGSFSVIDIEAYYYKIVVTKLTVLT